MCVPVETRELEERSEEEEGGDRRQDVALVIC